MNYYPLKCWELRENGSREEGIWRKEGRREKGGRGREKKGELIRERRAFFPEIRVGVLDPSSSSPRFYLHDCVDRPFSPLFLSSHTRGSTGSFVRAHLVARTLTSSSSSSFESSSRTEPCHHPPLKRRRKKEKKETHGQLIDTRQHVVQYGKSERWNNPWTPPAPTVISFFLTLVAKSGRGEVSRPSARHAATFSTRTGVRRSFPFESSPMGGSRSLSTDDPRSLTQLSPQLSFPRSCSPLTSCARVPSRRRERERAGFPRRSREARHRRTHDPRGTTNPLETEHDKRRRQQLNTRESYTAV